MEEKATYSAGKAQSTHLGDGVYATFDGYHVILYTYDGLQKSDMIYLEDRVMNALAEFAKKCFGRQEDEHDS